MTLAVFVSDDITQRNFLLMKFLLGQELCTYSSTHPRIIYMLIWWWLCIYGELQTKSSSVLEQTNLTTIEGIFIMSLTALAAIKRHFFFSVQICKEGL